MKKRNIIIASVVSVIVVVAIIVTVFISKGGLKSSTEYNAYKNARMNNYTYLNKNYSDPNQTVLIGDSIIEFYNSADLFEDYTKATGVSVYNRGTSGDTSDRMLERMETNVVNINPRNLVILIGTNDNGKMKVKDTVKNITEAVELVQKRCPETNIILQAIYPVNHGLSAESKGMVGDRNNKEIGEINYLLEKMSKDKNITFLNLTKALSDENGNLNPAYTYDGLHPNVQGYEIVTRELIPLLK